jgi:hypothetical protein
MNLAGSDLKASVLDYLSSQEAGADVLEIRRSVEGGMNLSASQFRSALSSLEKDNLAYQDGANSRRQPIWKARLLKEESSVMT